MDGDLSASSLTQRAKFNIDLDQLGIFLADTFITRVDAFVPADRITILKACRERLAAEGGDIVDHLLTVSPQPHLAQPGSSDIVHTPTIL